MNKQEKRKYDLAVFDVDGTLLNTEEGVLKSAEYAILQTGREVPDFQTMRTFIGPPIQDSFQRVFHVQGKDLAQMTETFRSCYSTQNLLKAVPYDGLYEMLDNLFKFKKFPCVSCDKSSLYSNRLLCSLPSKRIQFLERTSFKLS